MKSASKTQNQQAKLKISKQNSKSASEFQNWQANRKIGKQITKLVSNHSQFINVTTDLP
jgi:hypothetical protein